MKPNMTSNSFIGNGGLERLISSHVEVSKIGRQIAEEVLDLQRRSDQDSSSGNSPTPAPESALVNTEVNINISALSATRQAILLLFDLLLKQIFNWFYINHYMHNVLYTLCMRM
jgi:hypothetical protein